MQRDARPFFLHESFALPQSTYFIANQDSCASLIATRDTVNDDSVMNAGIRRFVKMLRLAFLDRQDPPSNSNTTIQVR